MYSKIAIQKILKQVSDRKITHSEAYQKLKHLSYETLKESRLDHHRVMRTGLPEVVFGPGKTPKQLQSITDAFLTSGQPFLITRLKASTFNGLHKKYPRLQYANAAQLAYVKPKKKASKLKPIAIVTAGTSDLPVAQEAAITLEVMERRVKRFEDVGVAGLQRLLDHIPSIEAASVVICVAGMEGALASVLAGLISKPIIAVPTSVGYGANFKGIAPLLSMMSTCAQGVAVVNIDSGFNAACFASLI